jgi:amino acid adenylation domain-containing protein
MSVLDIENLYALSPMQQGLLFHSLYELDAGLYVNQLVFELEGELDVPLLERAWQQVIARHAALRTSFHWEQLDKPLQVVHPQVQISLTPADDLRPLPPDAQQERLEHYLEQERRRGFDLARAPLMRLALFRLADSRYQFIWSFHHIILDGWSSSIVRCEVFKFYEALRRGETPHVETGPPFSLYIAWLRQQDTSAAEAFWRERLKGLAITNLVGVQTPQHPVGLQRGVTVQEVHLSAELSAALQTFARRHQLTQNTLLQGAWGLLLSRYTGEPDIIFGVTVAGRPEAIAGIESMVGNLINTVPFRLQVSPTDTVLDWLKKVQTAQSELHGYEYTPLSDVQQWGGGHDGPLFDSLLVFENVPRPDLAANGRDSVRVRDARLLYRTNYPLTIQAAPGPRLVLQAVGDERRIGASFIARLLGHLETLLADFVARPGQPLATCLGLTEAEAHQALVEWNDTRTTWPERSSLHELFERQVARTPDAVSVIYKDHWITYKELNERANQLAHRLRLLGVGPESLVCLCVEPSLEMMVGLLGVLKAGGACVPLDPADPPERLALMLDNAACSVVLTQRRFAALFRDRPGHTLSLDDDEVTAQQSRKNPGIEVGGERLAYVMYTSGSTGRPKGVEVCHRGIVRLLSGVDYVRLGSADTFLQLSNVSFDASFFEIWGALLRGGRCVLPPDRKLALEDLESIIAAHGVSVLWLTASLFNAVVDKDPLILSGVRELLIGGEALSVAHVERALANLTATHIINGYGPTECTTFTCCHRLPRELDKTINSIPIGRPIANTQVYVLDRRLNPTPVGAVGELYVGGAGLARGYRRRPDATAEHFIPDPFSPEPGARLYRTGDLVRHLPDGKLEFVGRYDQQVKVRGFRVELGEIEATLTAHPGVRAAVVTACEDAPGGRCLLAYVTAKAAGRERPAEGELRDFLKARLPDYMLPAAFVWLDSLPLTPRGKVDRRALPAPAPAAREQPYVAPRAHVEELLANIWSAVLGVEQVGRHDDFFALGGHSLLATRLISRVRESFRIELPLRSLFDAPTVAGLAERVEKLLRAGLRQDAPQLRPTAHAAPPPLSFAQQRLWVLDQFDPGLPAYNIPAALRIAGALDVAALAKSLNEIVRRHEALRTSFRLVDGRPVQIIAAAQVVTLGTADLSELPEREREAEVRRLAAEAAWRRFDLARGPLLRASLLRLGQDRHVLLVTMHHIVADGWSLELFFRELSALYKSFSGGGPALPDPPVQYADYATWQREWLQGETLDEQFAYWQRQLADAPAALNMPTDHQRPPIQTFRGGQQFITLPGKLTAVLRALSRAERTTLFMTLLAGFKALLHRYTGATDVLVGTPVANRGRVEIENVIGFFVNTLVLRTSLAGDPSFRESLSRVRKVSLEAYAHQDVPFEKLVEELQPVRNLSLSPFFQVLFTFQPALRSALELPGLSTAPLEVAGRTAKFDLSLAVVERGDGLLVVAEYNTDLFDASTITRLLNSYHLLLERASADPESPISALPLLTSAERHQLAVEWNDMRADYPRASCLHQLFEAQAARTPDATALVFGIERLSYGELNRRADCLAARLRRLGVGPEVAAIVMMERAPEMVVALLGVLKAGGAYVPLDPAYPHERLAFMLADSQARVLLTQEWLQCRLPESDAEVVFVGLTYDDDVHARPPGAGEVADEGAGNARRSALPENLAYIIYTSGSTGQPKGVAITHRSATALMSWARARFTPDELGAALFTTSVCFDLSVFELFAPLSWGGTVVLAESVLDLAGSAGAAHVQLVNSVPSAVAELVQAGGLPGSVRTVNLAGEPIPSGLARELHRQAGVAQVLNLYGPTEDTTYSTCATVAEEDGRAVIGRPVANKRAYVLDEQMQVLPLGVVGEIFLGGEGLARGYLRRPDMTAERFVPDPLSGATGARLYRTGDLGRYLPDGQLEFLGRADQQVKVRGYRIELGEIETALNSLHGVREAAVVVREDSAGDRRLVGYVMTARGSGLTAGELQGHLRARLPDFMVPATLVLAEELPRTPNGKIDRRALPKPQSFRREPEQAYAAPRTEIELLIVNIWQEVLRVERIGTHDNFFSDLGGHSLLMIQVAGKLQESLNRKVSIVEMFQHPTIHSLAKHLSDRSGEPSPQTPAGDDPTQARWQAIQRRRQFKQSRRAVESE